MHVVGKTCLGKNQTTNGIAIVQQTHVGLDVLNALLLGLVAINCFVISLASGLRS